MTKIDILKRHFEESHLYDDYLDLLCDLFLDCITFRYNDLFIKWFRKSLVNYIYLKHTLLHYASYEGNLELVEFMVGQGFNVNDEDEINLLTPVCCATKYNQIHVVHYFIENCVLDDYKNQINTCLSLASTIGNFELVKYLIEKGADVNFVDRYGKHTIHSACVSCNEQVFDIIVKHNGDLKVIDDNGDTLLHIAVYFNSINIVKYLINLGFDIEIKNNKDQTALDIAINEGYQDIIDCLVYNNKS